MLAEPLPGQLAQGDPAPEIVQELTSVVHEVTELRARLQGPLSEAVQASLDRLVDTLRRAWGQGEAWKDDVALPRLDTLARGQQMRRAYRPYRRGL